MRQVPVNIYKFEELEGHVKQKLLAEGHSAYIDEIADDVRFTFNLFGRCDDDSCTFRYLFNEDAFYNHVELLKFGQPFIDGVARFIDKVKTTGGDYLELSLAEYLDAVMVKTNNQPSESDIGQALLNFLNYCSGLCDVSDEPIAQHIIEQDLEYYADGSEHPF